MFFLPENIRPFADQHGTRLNSLLLEGPPPLIEEMYDDPNNYFRRTSEWREAGIIDASEQLKRIENSQAALTKDLEEQKMKMDNVLQQHQQEKANISQAFKQREHSLLGQQKKKMETVLLQHQQEREQQKMKMDAVLQQHQQEQAHLSQALEQRKKAMQEQRQKDLVEQKRLKGRVNTLIDKLNLGEEELANLQNQRQNIQIELDLAKQARTGAERQLVRSQAELQSARDALDARIAAEEALRREPMERVRRTLRIARSVPTYRVARPKDVADAKKMRYSALGRDSTYLNALHSLALGNFHDIVGEHGDLLETPEGERDMLLDPYIRRGVEKFKLRGFR